MERCVAISLGIALVFLAAVTDALYSSSSDVVQLNPNNFNDKVIKSDAVWLVEFYAPWCGHCKNLAPEWDKAASALKGIVKIGAVDADNHKSLGGQYGVRGFPTIKIFGANKQKPTDYQGGRTADAIVTEAIRVAKDVASSRLGGKKSGGSGGSGSRGSGGGEKPSDKDVITLTDSNFDEEVLGSTDPWLVEFYAPWCGHCKNLAPEWAKAATELKGKFKLGALDATVETVKASAYGVRGYPTIKYFPAGKKEFDSPEDYNGGRSASDIVNWANAKVADAMPPPEVLEITDEKVLKDACEAHQLCVISFLPHILDSGAVGRNQYLQHLKDNTERHKQWGWVWAEAGAQPELENSLGIGGFGYPAMAVLNGRKMTYTKLKGPFSKEGIHEYLRAASMGRGLSTEVVPGKKLGEIKKTDPWDGKDGVMPEEEDIDLSDFDMDEEEGKDEL
ncbi:protein disulfide-isomerase A6-like [Acanthaster planci]|uniref:protein disulfide-isomerase n=1 Tax=Acanthaster planci TaxID=133434 RepID=A0A8B7XSW7_ACAPL|nr:protein disulfide-isomerase A6-like [Acanthaster planci]